MIKEAGQSTGERRVLRGGSWFDVGGDLRDSDRNWGTPSITNYSFGFRLVAAPAP